MAYKPGASGTARKLSLASGKVAKTSSLRRIRASTPGNTVKSMPLIVTVVTLLFNSGCARKVVSGARARIENPISTIDMKIACANRALKLKRSNKRGAMDSAR